MGQPDEPGARRAAFATYRGERRSLAPGTVLTFGRADGCDLQVAAGDEWVSRQVGVLRRDADAVILELTRSRHVVRVVTPAQTERLLEPRPEGAVQERLPLVWEHATVVLAGAGNVDHRVFVVTGEPPGGDARRPVDDPGLIPTATFNRHLSGPEPLLLAALAEPLLRFGQVAEPATYAMIAVRLGAAPQLSGRTLTPRMVRRQLEELFERLTTQDRVPGLLPDEDEDAAPSEASSPRVRRLAVWAVLHGVSTIDDLDRLP